MYRKRVVLQNQSIHMTPCYLFAWIIVIIPSLFGIYLIYIYNYDNNNIIPFNKFNEQKNNNNVIIPIKYHVDTNFCNIERRTDVSLSTKEFREKYAGKKPVIIVHTLKKNRNKYFQQITTYNNILNSFGELQIILSTANSYTKIKRKVTVSEYLRRYLNTTALNDKAIDTFYWFGDNYNILKPLTDQFRINNYAGPKYNTPSFGVGGKLSGVPFHFHGGGFSEVIHGKKRWWLHKDKLPFNGNETQLQWLEKFYSKVVQDLKSKHNYHSATYGSTSKKDEQETAKTGTLLMECTIQFGEALYFPSQWYHATLNLDKYTAFVSTFTDDENEMSYGDIHNEEVEKEDEEVVTVEEL